MRLKAGLLYHSYVVVAIRKLTPPSESAGSDQKVSARKLCRNLGFPEKRFPHFIANIIEIPCSRVTFRIQAAADHKHVRNIETHPFKWHIVPFPVRFV